MKFAHRFLLLLLASFFIFPKPLQSQENNAIIQLVMNSSLTDSLSVKAEIAEFERQHEGIEVQLVADNRINESLNDWQRFFSLGDVLYIEGEWMNAELTRTGYLLDLEPIYSVDELSSSSHFGADSFVWDGGRWAIPIGLKQLFLNYEPLAFDEAGLSPLDSDWTLSDLQFAASQLAENYERAPIFVDERALPALIRYALNQNLYDETSFPIEPDFQGAEETISLLREMQANGLIEIGFLDSPDDTEAPIFLGSALGFWDLESRIMLPLGSSASGLAISAGTDQPELAFELIRFISQNSSLLFGTSPIFTELEDDYYSDAFSELLSTDFSQVPSFPDMLFTDYLRPLIASELEIETALQEAEAEARNSLSTAEERRSESIVVNAPRVRPVVEGVSLKFSVSSNISPLPTQFSWESLAQSFVEENPDIGEVIIEAGSNSSMELLSQVYDCYYLPDNYVLKGDFSHILPLSPLMDVDPTFDSGDFLGDSLAQVTRDNQIWAFPMDIQPLAMWMSDEFVESTGIDMDEPLTMEAFMSLLASVEGEGPIIKPYVTDGSHLLSFIYAFDGLPFDYSVYPPTVNFTAPETVEAIRTTLRWIEDGTMDYVPLIGSFNGATGIAPILIAPLNDSYSRNGEVIYINGSPRGRYRPYMLPQGRTYAPLSYNMGTAYISANTDYPNECYRFLSYISQQPLLFSGMPARLSTLDDERLATSRPEQVLNFYRNVAETSQVAERMVIPAYGNSSFTADQARQEIFYRAIDLVMAEEMSLEEALAQAETIALEFQHCLEQAEEADPQNPLNLYNCSPNDWISGQ